MSTTLHHGTCFLICDEGGDLVAGTEHGLYFEDVRCLSSWRLLVDGEPLLGLGMSPARPDACSFFATNPKSDRLPADKLIVRRQRTLEPTLRDEFVVDSYADDAVTLELCLEFGADFADIYEVKKRAIAALHDAESSPHAKVTHDDTKATLVREIHGTRCTATLAFSRAPDDFDGGAARFSVELSRGRPWTLAVEIDARIEHPDAARDLRSVPARPRKRKGVGDGAPTLESDHPVLPTAYAHAASDLVALRLNAEENIDGEYAIAAGIPWYMALFGRDSLIASYQTLLHDPELARGTLTALAHLQGRTVDPASEEQPGRILHEYRKYLRQSVRRDIPKFPYYGTIDATPLFVITLAEYARTTGDLELPKQLWGNVERALDWIDDYGDCDGDGFVEYATRRGGFLVNEGWKDSGDSVRFRDGTLARQPIALVEVQGYVVAAWRGAAELADALGHGELAGKLRPRADRLVRAIADQFWLDERRTFAEALDGDKRPVDSLTSNPGQLLWSRAVDDDRAREVAAALLGESMSSGWGVRTMGASEGGYDPVSYHNGSVWPHDNSIFLHGLSRYGLRDETAALADALLAALAAEPGRRFPELWSGVGRDAASIPVAYPNANEPQAWASGAVMLIVRALLGLEVDALHARLHLAPSRLSQATWLRLCNLPIGGARVTIEVKGAGQRPRARVDGLPAHWRVDVG